MKYSTSITFKNKFRKYFINNFILKYSNIYLKKYSEISRIRLPRVYLRLDIKALKGN